MLASEIAETLLELIKRDGDFDVMRIEVTAVGFTVNVISSDEGIKVIE